MYKEISKKQHLEQLNSALFAWKGKLSTHERGDVAKYLDLHPRILENYINGQGTTITTCEAILNHLQVHYPIN
jgi:hypothetical protein